MKKKVFSKLLMGALLVASVSSFTSCKDYDDDINDLRSRIDGLNTSLTTTVTEKIKAAEAGIASLTNQLDEVKANYAKADESLQKQIDAVVATGKVNGDEILKLQGEVVNLKTADANLQAAIDKLEGALKEANGTLKTQGETLSALQKVDEALEKGITEAKAQAANAKDEATKAQEAAATNAANLKSTDATVAALQKTVADNLTTVNAKIDDAVNKLNNRVLTNETNIGKMQEKVAANEANIVTINSKLATLETKDGELLAALNTAKEKLAGDITAETAAREKAIKALTDRVSANETAIDWIKNKALTSMQTYLETHIVPETVTAEVAKQLPAALDVFFTDEVKPYVEDIVATETGKNKSLINALTDKVKQDSTDLAAFTDAQFLLTAGLLAGKYELDDEASADALAAKALADAIADADAILQDNIDIVAGALADEKNADKAGSLAALIAQIKNDADETSIAGKLKALTNGFNATVDETNPASLAGRFKTIEDFFAPAADDAEAADISVANLAAKIAETETFTEAVKTAANDANGEILGMITSINLFANQHHAMADERGKIEKEVRTTKGEKTTYSYSYPAGYDNFDHYLTFVSTIENGQYTTDGELVKSPWNFPEDYVNDENNPNAYNYTVGDSEDASAAVEQYDFVDLRYRSYEDSILVRVSPTNADLRKATLALLNSQGEDIISLGLVQVEEVNKYTRPAGEYLTRGEETGLWVIKFKLVDDANTGELYSKYAYNNAGDILYAVAVKNTGVKVVTDEETEKVTVENEEGSVARYVVSEYDLSLARAWAKHSYDFFANEISVNDIHNRYIETEQGEGGTTIWTDDPERASFRYELTWKPLCADDIKAANVVDPTEDPEATEETEYKYIQYTLCCPDCFDLDDQDDCDDPTGWSKTWFDADKNEIYKTTGETVCGVNAVDRLGHSFTDQGVRQRSGEDNRHLKEFLPITFSADQAPEGEEGEWAKIEIEFPAFNECGEMTPIRGFFVTLDQKFALESNNSEINAWVSYVYKNVAYFSTNHGQKDGRYDVPITLQKGNKGVIYIKDTNNIYDKDVIGFRVHAVNLDGTLTDPDGRAFYVQVGKTEIEHNLSFNITVESDNAPAYAVQDLVDGKNPIKAFNDACKADGDDTRFFIRDAYTGSFDPAQGYNVRFEWGENNPALRLNYSDDAYVPVAGTQNQFVNLRTGESAFGNFRNGGNVNNFFSFMFSEYADATIEEKDGDRDNEWRAYNATYDNNQKVAANRLTQSVRAAINASYANNLQNYKTYYVKMIVTRTDSKTGTKVINKYNLAIYKNMPTELPKKLTVKSNQLSGGAWTFYMRPVGDLNTQRTPWQNPWYDYAAAWKKKSTFAAGFDGDKDLNDDTEEPVRSSFHMYRWGYDVRPYNFDEMFNGLYILDEDDEYQQTNTYDRNFYFVFEGAGNFFGANELTTANNTYAKTDAAYKDANAIALYDDGQIYGTYIRQNPYFDHVRGHYALPMIHWSHISDGKKYNVKAGYIYRRISAELAEDGKTFLDDQAPKNTKIGRSIANEDWVIDAEQIKVGNDDLKAEFKCAFDEAVVNNNFQGKDDTGEPTVAKTYTFEYNQNVKIDDAFTAQFYLKSKQWKYISADDANLQAYFDAWLEMFNLAVDKDNNVLSPYDASKADAIKGETQAISLDYLLDNNYLWLDETSLKATASAPANYVVSNYYYAPFWVKRGSEIVGIQMNTLGGSQGLPDFKEDVTGKFSFDVYDVWFHKRTITIDFKVKKPTNITGARATR